MTTPVPPPLGGHSQPDVHTFIELTQEMGLDPNTMPPHELLERASESSLLIAAESLTRTQGILAALPEKTSTPEQKQTVLMHQAGETFENLQNALYDHPALQTLSPHEISSYVDSKKQALLKRLGITGKTKGPNVGPKAKKRAPIPPFSPPGEIPGPLSAPYRPASSFSQEKLPVKVKPAKMQPLSNQQVSVIHSILSSQATKSSRPLHAENQQVKEDNKINQLFKKLIS